MPVDHAHQAQPRLDPSLPLLLLTNRCEIVDEFSRIRLIRFLIFVAAAGKGEREGGGGASDEGQAASGPR